MINLSSKAAKRFRINWKDLEEPFSIYYQIENKVIKVYAILDCRRDPVWIRERLS